MMNFKHCAIRLLHPWAIKFEKLGFPLVKVETRYPLLTKPPKLDSNINSQDYTVPLTIAEKIRQLHKDESYNSYFEEAKLLFQIILSALAYNNPGLLNGVRSIQFTIQVKDKNHSEIIYDFTGFIEKFFGYLVTQRKHEDISITIKGERISLSVFFNTTDDKDDYDPWADLGYKR